MRVALTSALSVAQLKALAAGPLRQPPPRESAHARGDAWARKSGEATEFAIFWFFIAGLAWVPFLWGSNVLLAWGINALIFPGLAAVYELSLVVRGKSHPFALREIWIPASLFAAVVAWIVIQDGTWTPLSWHYPIWSMTADALHRPVAGSISVNRDLTTQALIRLITAASVFWVAVQLCRDAARARHLIEAIAAIGCGYAIYGFISYSLSATPINWFGHTGVRYVTSSFYNRNHYATYAGIGVIAIGGIILRFYRDEIALMGGALRHKIGAVIDATARLGAILGGGAFLVAGALFMTGSRGGILATMLGVGVLCILWFRRRPSDFTRQSRPFRTPVLIALLIILAFGASLASTFGDAFFGKMAQSGLSDTGRISVYSITLRSIFDSLWLGYGYGTFADVFPIFRDRTISTLGIWQQAHNTYLEIFQGLGIAFGSMLLACVILLTLRCFRGAIERQKGIMVCCVATSVTFLVGVNALVDFSLQMQAVTLTFTAILGAGVAQSKSSRSALHD